MRSAGGSSATSTTARSSVLPPCCWRSAVPRVPRGGGAAARPGHRRGRREPGRDPRAGAGTPSARARRARACGGARDAGVAHARARGRWSRTGSYPSTSRRPCTTSSPRRSPTRSMPAPGASSCVRRATPHARTSRSRTTVSEGRTRLDPGCAGSPIASRRSAVGWRSTARSPGHGYARTFRVRRSGDAPHDRRIAATGPPGPACLIGEHAARSAGRRPRCAEPAAVADRLPSPRRRAGRQLPGVSPERVNDPKSSGARTRRKRIGSTSSRARPVSSR